MSNMLVIDDEPSICWGLDRLGRKMGLEVTVASSAEQGLAAATRQPPNVIMLDVRLPGMDGLTALDRFRELLGEVPVIIMTAYGSLDVALRATRPDVHEYLVKPFDLTDAADAINRALNPARDVDVAPAAATKEYGLLVGRSPKMQEVFRQVALASSADVPVLLVGESGTGKELAAREIHAHSSRSHQPFVAVNVAALTPSLAESELFGHVRGAFTGADQSRPGLLVQAHGGTLFLDEVAEIPLPVQVKLLRALEQGEVLPVGASRPVPARFRIISASHRDLTKLIERAEFRLDLYYRLAGFRIDLPPLRERADDIELLASHFLAGVKFGGQVPAAGISAEAMTELRSRTWPGNVRELKSAVEHACLIARGGLIEPQHLPEATKLSPRNLSAIPDGSVEELQRLIDHWARHQLASSQENDDLYEQLIRLVEKPLFAAVLEHHHGQVATAARQLGLHRTTLKRKLEDGP